MSSPYIPNTQADRQEMLRTVGLSSIDELFGDIPEGYRTRRWTFLRRFLRWS